MRIAEGIDLHFIKSEKFKTTMICVLLRCNLERDLVTKNTLMASVMKDASRKYPNIASINAKVETMYGGIFDVQIIKKSEEQMIQFYLELINDDFAEGLLSEGLAFLKELIFSPLIENGLFNEEYFQREKQILQNMIEGRINNKSEYAVNRLFEVMCKEEPFGIYGDGYLEDLSSITNEALVTHYNKMMAQMPIDIIILGKGTEKEIAGQVSRFFDVRRENIQKPKTAVQVYAPKEMIEIEDDIEVTQSKICLGVRAKGAMKGKALYALILFNEILGGGSSSKLFQSVREKENLCYYVRSTLYRFKSVLLIESGVEEKQLKKTKEIIVKELEQLKNGDFTEDDVEGAKKSVLKKYHSVEDSPSATIDFYTTQYIAEDTDQLAHIEKRIKNVTHDDVLAVAQTIYIDTVYYSNPVSK